MHNSTATWSINLPSTWFRARTAQPSCHAYHFVTTGFGRMKSARTMLGGTDTSSDTDHLLQVLRRHRQQIEFARPMLALIPPDSTCGESSVARHATTNDDKGIPPIHLGRFFTSTVNLYTGQHCKSQYHRRQKVQLARCLPSQLP